MGGCSPMKSSRILFAKGPRLLWEMLKRVLDQEAGLLVINEVTDQDELAGKIEQTDADWALVSLLPNDGMPEIAESLLAARPSLGIVALSLDGGTIRIKRAAGEDEQLDDLTLDELITLLRKESSA